ncbi:hypothetical protein BDD12DRAFT_982922 [Trichophaea hybrida]|nr:hypothetical protein BDD12DRAFT_982922 [Trichophaea hybrida]
MKFNITILTLFVTEAFTSRHLSPRMPKFESDISSCSTDMFAQDAYRKAMDNGIDPDGPMPEDFTENNGRWISFAEGSKFALWAAAQSAVVSKRAPDGRCILDIVYISPSPEDRKMLICNCDCREYTGPNCDGHGNYYHNVIIPGWYPRGQESHSLQVRNCDVDRNTGRLA